MRSFAWSARAALFVVAMLNLHGAAFGADAPAAPSAKAPASPKVPEAAPPAPPVVAAPAAPGKTPEAKAAPAPATPPSKTDATAAKAPASEVKAPVEAKAAVPPRGKVEAPKEAKAHKAGKTEAAEASGEAVAAAPEAEHAKEPAPPKTPAERPPPPVPQKNEHAVTRKDTAPPSLTLEALHAEIANSPAEIERNNLLRERERIGELAGALDIAQKQLRQDTEKLAAYLDEVRAQTIEIKNKKQAEKEQAKKVEAEAKATEEAKALEAKSALAPKGPTPPTPLEVLSKAMRGMKPAQAAAITERLPLTLAGDLMERMPARDAGKVMGLMNPERAAALASEIAAREDRRKKATK